MCPVGRIAYRHNISGWFRRPTVLQERLDRLQELVNLAARPESWLAAEGQAAAKEDMDASVQGLPGLSGLLEHAALVTGGEAVRSCGGVGDGFFW